LTPDEIVVVDSLSTDGTAEILQSYQAKYPFIKIVSRKCTVSMGRHLAIDVSTGDYILSADVGTTIPKNWLESYRKIINDNPECDYIKGNYYFEYDSDDLELAIYDKIIKGISSNLTVQSLASNRSVLYSRSLYNKVGGLNLNLSFAGDDTVLSALMTTKANKIMINDLARVGWMRPSSFHGLLNEARNYGKGDGEAMRLRGKSRFTTILAAHYLFSKMLIVGLLKLSRRKSGLRMRLILFHIRRSYVFTKNILIGYNALKV
jgi:glycosyltransferase involved in cell wall biosynthesis